MANEIDLYKDLAFCDKMIKYTNGDTLANNAWLKERQNIIEEIKENYPDLILGGQSGRI